MELVSIANEIESKIRLLEKGRRLLKERGENKATTIATHEKCLAKTVILLKNGETVQVDGKEITSPPVTIIEKIARGVCFQSKLSMELAEAEYKAAIVGLETLRAELNALQSIFRHLEEK